MKTLPIILSSLFTLAGSATAMNWVHPGTLDGKAELDYVKAQLAANPNAEPWATQLNSMINVENLLLLSPTPETSIDANKSANNSRDNARTAYGDALAWYLTGNDAYAKEAVAYLNAWSVLDSIHSTDQQKQLQGGWIGALFAPAADIMLGYSGWAAADIANFRAMLKRAFYPVLNTMSTWNGNVDLTQIDAMMAIAVVEEDSTEFNLGLQRLAKRVPSYFYLSGTVPAINGDGNNVNTFWSNPTLWVAGLTQETCRDNDHHAQFAMSAAFGAAEIAWHQGVDVFTTYQDRFVAAEELMGIQMTSGSMQGTCANDVTTTDIYDTWEIGYNHYHTRKGVAMPNSLAMITQDARSTQSNQGSWNIFYETLTHANIVYSNSSSVLDNSNSSKNVGAVSLHHNGICEIQATHAGRYDVATLALNGTQLNHTSLQLSAGEERAVSLGVDQAPAGVYLVQVRSDEGVLNLKYVK